MEFINDGADAVLAYYRLHPVRSGFILYGLMALIVFVIDLTTRKEDDRYNPIPNIVKSVASGAFWPHTVWYSYILNFFRNRVDIFSSMLFFLLFICFLANISTKDKKLAPLFNNLDLGFGTVPQDQISLAILFMMTVTLLVGYVLKKRQLDANPPRRSSDTTRSQAQ